MQEGKAISIMFMTEKMEGHGEDAPPLLVIKDNTFAVGVFDGMGGAGAATCNSEYGENYTKAYVASRMVASSVQSYLESHLGIDSVLVENMKDVIVQRLRNEQEKYPPETKSMLRSKLVREYPTTMAVITLTENEKDMAIDCFWAGDSHCYLWKRDGFYQISKDDLEEDNDPLENLHNDAAISNCVCADRDFWINHRHIVLKSKEPVAILSASDGCFGYYSTPMHFEDVLKSTLGKARDEKDWQEKIEKQIQKVTGDDTSLSLIGVGFNSFGTFKSLMRHKKYSAIKKIKELESEIANLRNKLDKATNERQKVIRDGWEGYKQKYMKYLNSEDNANA